MSILKELECAYRCELMLSVISGILTYQEYEAEYKGKYINAELGTDSFFGFLETVRIGVKKFGTSNKAMIKDAEKLEKRFGVKIN